MSQRKAHKRNLSSGILEMKFMKKSKEKSEKEKQDLESADLFADNINHIKKSSKSDGSQFVTEHSMFLIESLQDGRMSFKGMNPEIERLMQEDLKVIKEEIKAKERYASNQPEISDSDMAARLRHTVANKFNKKKAKEQYNSDEDNEIEETPPKKGKFLKPKDD